MKIGLFGYGKMGQTIERLAPAMGCEIAWKISRQNRREFSDARLAEADVIIEFTRPESAFERDLRSAAIVKAMDEAKPKPKAKVGPN